MTKTHIVFGSRESDLAVKQARIVMDALQTRYPELSMELKTFKTTGDRLLDSPLSAIGGKGLFVKELEVALLNGDIDCAIHSMKDMPAQQPDGLTVISFGQRDYPFDAFVSRSGQAFMDLPAGSVVGTASLRRQIFMKRRRPDLQYQPIRGNVQTRLSKLDDGQFDAIVLATAGLNRLGLEERIIHIFKPDDMLPACCQGILGVEFADLSLTEWFVPFNLPVVQAVTDAERSFLFALEGSCQVPLAAYASLNPGRDDGEQFLLKGMLSDLTGEQVLEVELTFAQEFAQHAGREAAREILEQGGDRIIDSILAQQQNTP